METPDSIAASIIAIGERIADVHPGLMGAAMALSPQEKRQLVEAASRISRFYRGAFGA